MHSRNHIKHQRSQRRLAPHHPLRLVHHLQYAATMGKPQGLWELGGGRIVHHVYV